MNKFNWLTAAVLSAVITESTAGMPASNGMVELPFGTAVPAIDTNNKDQVTLLYYQYYYWPGYFDAKQKYQIFSQFPISANWTGDTKNCIAGSINPAMSQAGIRQINFFRSLAGLRSAQMGDSEERLLAQSGALITAANNALNHYPTGNAKCFSEASRIGAANSNLSLILGAAYWPSDLGEYIDDSGAENFGVGHRRSFLHPNQLTYSYGYAEFTHPSFPKLPSSANAIYATNVSQAKAGDTPQFVTWPYAGYVPFQLLPIGSNRWSISCTGCDFSGATVRMKKDGINMEPPAYEKLAEAFGQNTLVFKPVGVDYSIGVDMFGFSTLVPLSKDATYEVSVENIGVPSCLEVGCPKVASNYIYNVRVFDPEQYFNKKALPRTNYSDLWQFSEERDGSIILQQMASGALYGNWLFYDSIGQPTRVVMPSGKWRDSTTFTGPLYTTLGSTSFSAREVGSVTVKFNDDSSANLSYSLNGVSVSKIIQRRKFGIAAFGDGRNFTDLWGTQERGWAIAINQQYQTLRATVLTHDVNGQPIWYELSGCDWTTSNVCSGALSAPSLVAGQVLKASVGSAMLNFSTENKEATITLSINGEVTTKKVFRGNTSAFLPPLKPLAQRGITLDDSGQASLLIRSDNAQMMSGQLVGNQFEFIKDRQ